VSELFSFPNPVNEKAARVVAGLVLVTCLAALAASQFWLLAPLAAGFLARVLTGPRLSPFGLLATKVVAPRLGEPHHVAGPPKRFAQAIGLAMTSTGAVLALGFGLDGAATVVLVAMIVATGLESIFALCLGCKAFAGLMRAGLVPANICAECADFRAA
jgi:Domain of unknown function (DUF4395)